MKKLLFAVAFIAATFSTTAQKLENSTLWKITGNGLEEPSYLFGTIHITCDATLSDKVKLALDKTSQIVLEIDMDDPALQGKMMGGMMMKGGKSLKDLVSKEEYAKIDSLFINNMGMSVSLMQTVKPFFLSAMFYPKMIDCPMQSFELEIMKVAKEQKEEVYGLETIEDQIQVFEDIPYSEQVKELVRSANDNLAYDRSVIKRLLEVYKSENITAMLDMMDEEGANITANFQDEMLDQRNKNWIPRIEEFAKKKPTFFGVGAGHLAGKNGVIKLLRKAGFTVTAVK